MQSDFQQRAEDLYQAGVADGFRAGFVNTIKKALEEAAMSAAEPVAWRYKFTDGEDWAGLTFVDPTAGQLKHFVVEPLYAAPSVALAVDEEALDKAAREEWAQSRKTHGPRVLEQYASNDIMEAQSLRARVIVTEYLKNLALSAQVKDVAGWQEVPPETVIEEATKGKQVLAYENGRYYNAWLEFEASEGGWLWYDEADSEPNPTHWMPLPAAPAKQEVGHVTSK